MSTDYNVKVTIRNGRLLSRIRDAGYASALAFCKAHGLHYGAVQPLVSLKQTGMTSKDAWRRNVVVVSDILQCMPEDIVPPQHWRDALHTNTAEIPMTAEQVATLTMAAVPSPDGQLILEDRNALLERMLQGLKPREERVLRLRYGIGCDEHTLDETGQQFGVAKERIRQIEAKAMRKLKFRDTARYKGQLQSYLHD